MAEPVAAVSGTSRPSAEVVADPAATASELMALAFTKKEKVRHGVAAHPNTPPSVLAGYTRLDHWTLVNVIGNPSLPEEIIMDRFDRPTSDTRGLLARAADRSPMSETFARFLLDRWVAEGGFRMMQQVPARVGGNPATPAAVLIDLAKSEDVDTLRAVAGNPSASARTRQRAAARAETFSARLAS